MNGMLEAHNEVRENVEPAADPPLPELTWSRDLETAAADYAANCRMEHDPDLGDLQMGENLAAYSGAGDQQAADPVNDWASEVADYDYETNGCTNVCGHYTQIVWRDTTEVGCAVEVCPDGLESFAPGREIWVCRYSPPGNWVGERPY